MTIAQGLPAWRRGRVLRGLLALPLAAAVVWLTYGMWLFAYDSQMTYAATFWDLTVMAAMLLAGVLGLLAWAVLRVGHARDPRRWALVAWPVLTAVLVAGGAVGSAAGSADKAAERRFEARSCSGGVDLRTLAFGHRVGRPVPLNGSLANTDPAGCRSRSPSAGRRVRSGTSALSRVAWAGDRSGPPAGATTPGSRCTSGSSRPRRSSTWCSCGERPGLVPRQVELGR